MIKVMFIIGTRPEAIKLAPLIHKARGADRDFKATVITTGQHREMLDDVLKTFEIVPDIDLNIMMPNQSISYITSKILLSLEKVMDDYKPELIIVQGDTSTTFAGSLAGYYSGARVAHIEAGLRTGNKWAPFPEEVNRKMTSVIADYHFAPTERARDNLLREGYEKKKVYVTGNTVIDALYWMVEKLRGIPCPVKRFSHIINRFEKMVLITGHRRENFGKPFQEICNAFKELSVANPSVLFVYPVHLNPNVQKTVKGILDGLDNFRLLPPLPYSHFVWFMEHCYMMITDSGGIQEEAPALGKPVLVTREVTERPEAIETGSVKLVGHDESKIVELSQKLLDDESFYRGMSQGGSPYGDGKASERIIKILKDDLCRKS